MTGNQALSPGYGRCPSATAARHAHCKVSILLGNKDPNISLLRQKAISLPPEDGGRKGSPNLAS